VTRAAARPPALHSVAHVTHVAKRPKCPLPGTFQDQQQITTGTELTRSGVDLVTVAELMGHASLETTRLYTRPSKADMQRAVDLLTTDE